MRETLTALVALATWVAQYPIFTLILWMFVGGSYVELLHAPNWAGIYLMVLGWWLPAILGNEFYKSRK